MTTEHIKVWDPAVRLFHWMLVAGFFIAYFTEDDFLTLHVWAGYAVAGLVVFRVFWGVIGPRYARFSNFVFAPSVVMAYLKDIVLLRPRRYVGHNPAAGAMIVALLVSLMITTVTGLAVYGAAENAGPLALWLGYLGEQGGEVFEEIHEFFANFTLFLVFIHVLGVLLESLIHRENLVRGMIDGLKRPESSSEQGV
ncbi:MAG: cytochrome b/b6 domain-containing protein [Gammaproteobacteria bacterium]|nr:cytochrome b/b6 domain-containing protein [Gammaproteobacteria bacterium]